MAACGGGVSLNGSALREIRDSADLDAYSDDDLLVVAEYLCQAMEDSGGSEGSGNMFDDAWGEVGADEAGLDELLASITIITTACPELSTSELVEENSAIPLSFTLRGSENDQFTYTAFDGCQGEGGYGDVHQGMLFNLTDEQGEVLGVARLDESALTSTGCEISGTFPVTFGELDDDVLYLVGDRAGRRGELAYTGAELKQQGSIDLVLGD